MSVWAIVVAAGDGTRLNAGGPKALATLAGRTLLEWSLDAVAVPSIDGVVVACGAAWRQACNRIVAACLGERGLVCVGGASRHASVHAALACVPVDAERIVIHDAARPLATPDLALRALAALDGASGAICAVPVADTIKRCRGEVIAETVDRSDLWRAQTPQAFRAGDLRAAIDAGADPALITDESVLLERAGKTVVVVAGDERNIKVTTPADLTLAEALVAAASGSGPMMAQ